MKTLIWDTYDERTSVPEELKSDRASPCERCHAGMPTRLRWEEGVRTHWLCGPHDERVATLRSHEATSSFVPHVPPPDSLDFSIEYFSTRSPHSVRFIQITSVYLMLNIVSSHDVYHR